MKEQFIGEPIRPVSATFDVVSMAAGEAGLPSEFIWRKRRVSVVAVLRTWKETGPCRHGSGEQYVRKHWFEIATSADGVMKVYFERQPSRGRGTKRWWLFSVRQDEA